MYGVILMAAMATTQSAPELGWKHSACCGYSACHGCRGYGACHGGCYGGCYGGWESLAPIHTPAGCWGVPYGCYGPGWGGYSCAGGCGGYQSAAYGVPTPEIATPGPVISSDPAPSTTPAPKGDPKLKPKADPDDDELVSAGTRARVVVSLPANGKLFVDDAPIANAAGVKTFRTPELSKGQQYYYEMRAEVVVDGKVVSQTRRVTVTAGELIRADFSTLGKANGVAANTR
jgi:uncharacterized protein (TIGR03000 family)